MPQMNLITANDVARRLNVSRFRVYELVREGDMPPNIVVPLGKRQMRFKPLELDEWIRGSRAREKSKQEIDESQSKANTPGLSGPRKRNSQRAA